MNILNNEDENKTRVEKNVKTIKNNIFKDNTMTTIILIMGLILVASLWIVAKPVPECPACPNVTIPTCPAMNCPNVTCSECPACPSLTCGNNNTLILNNTEYMNFTLTSLTIFNSTDYTMNKTFYLNASSSFNQTTEINTTALGLGEFVVIRVDYE